MTCWCLSAGLHIPGATPPRDTFSSDTLAEVRKVSDRLPLGTESGDAHHLSRSKIYAALDCLCSGPNRQKLTGGPHERIFSVSSTASNPSPSNKRSIHPCPETPSSNTASPIPDNHRPDAFPNTCCTQLSRSISRGVHHASAEGGPLAEPLQRVFVTVTWIREGVLLHIPVWLLVPMSSVNDRSALCRDVHAQKSTRQRIHMYEHKPTLM